MALDNAEKEEVKQSVVAADEPDKSGDTKDEFDDGSSVCIITLYFSNGAHHLFFL